MNTCTRCADGHPKRCPISWTFDIMVDVEEWLCAFYRDPDEQTISERMAVAHEFYDERFIGRVRNALD